MELTTKAPPQCRRPRLVSSSGRRTFSTSFASHEPAGLPVGYNLSLWVDRWTHEWIKRGVDLADVTWKVES